MTVLGRTTSGMTTRRSVPARRRNGRDGIQERVGGYGAFSGCCRITQRLSRREVAFFEEELRALEIKAVQVADLRSDVQERRILQLFQAARTLLLQVQVEHPVVDGQHPLLEVAHAGGKEVGADIPPDDPLRPPFERLSHRK